MFNWTEKVAQCWRKAKWWARRMSVCGLQQTAVMGCSNVIAWRFATVLALDPGWLFDPTRAILMLVLLIFSS
jgi:hypothetical protein